jgi:hypothetical protein
MSEHEEQRPVDREEEDEEEVEVDVKIDNGDDDEQRPAEEEVAGDSPLPRENGDLQPSAAAAEDTQRDIAGPAPEDEQNTRKRGPPDVSNMITLKVDNIPFSAEANDIQLMFEK